MRGGDAFTESEPAGWEGQWKWQWQWQQQAAGGDCAITRKTIDREENYVRNKAKRRSRQKMAHAGLIGAEVPGCGSTRRGGRAEAGRYCDKRGGGRSARARKKKKRERLIDRKELFGWDGRCGRQALPPRPASPKYQSPMKKTCQVTSKITYHSTEQSTWCTCLNFNACLREPSLYPEQCELS